MIPEVHFIHTIGRSLKFLFNDSNFFLFLWFLTCSWIDDAPDANKMKRNFFNSVEWEIVVCMCATVLNPMKFVTIFFLFAFFLASTRREFMLKKFSEIWHITSCYDQPFADTQYEIVPCQNQVVNFVPRGSRNRNVEHETGKL